MNSEASSAKLGFWNEFRQPVGISHTYKVSVIILFHNHTCCNRPTDTFVKNDN